MDGTAGKVLVRLEYANNHPTGPALSAQLALKSLSLVHGCCRRLGVGAGLLLLLPQGQSWTHQPAKGTAQTVLRHSRSPPMQSQPRGIVICAGLSLPTCTSVGACEPLPKVPSELVYIPALLSADLKQAAPFRRLYDTVWS